MTPTMQLRLRQHLTLTPQLQQALRLLQLSSLEFEQEMREAVASNPFLEEDTEAPPAPGDASAGAEPGPSAAPGPEEQARAERDAPVGIDEFPRAAPAPDGEDGDWTERSEAHTTLRDHVRDQLRLSQMGDRDRALANLVIDALDEDGYLRVTLDELAALLPAEHDVDPQEIGAALKLVQTLEPPGVGARSLQECLMLQLDALPDGVPGRPVARALVGRHIELLASREFLRLQQILGCGEAEIHLARTLIRSLDPHPGRRYGSDDTRYVVADVIVTKSARGKWTVAVNPAVLPRVRLNRAYAELAAARVNGGGLAQQLQEARWLIRNMEQRFVTIQRVAEAIVATQRHFFDYGDAAMKPLGLRQIAEKLGLHESTVCRVTNGKYMATPRGLFEFKHFFSRQLATRDGGACSATAIRALMRELIANERPEDPLSDAQLTRLLTDQGLHVARRTITKYRTLMRLPSVELRRAMAQHPAGRD